MQKFMRAVLTLLIATTCGQAEAQQQDAAPPIDLGVTYVADAIGMSATDVKDRAYALDNLDVTATADLGRLAGLTGMTAHVHVLNNLGSNPNNRAATLQGIDNIEVGSQRLRLFEAWIEQRIGRATTIRAGLYDLNSEFYANDAAGLLIAPAFGVGSEIAATGPNGPSIFPSTALSVRIDQRIATDGYLRVTALNANAGTIGDAQGVNLSFDDGALLVGEAGWQRGGKLALGLWTYTRRQPDLRDVDGAGDPVGREAHGVYVIGELPLAGSESMRAVSAFARVGLSDGRTTAFHGGFQAGLLVTRVVTGRPDSALSLGFNQAWLARGYRRNQRDAGITTARAESAMEITYADRIHPHLTVQPDVQLILDAAGERTRKPLLVAGLRLMIDL